MVPTLKFLACRALIKAVPDQLKVPHDLRAILRAFIHPAVDLEYVYVFGPFEHQSQITPAMLKNPSLVNNYPDGTIWDIEIAYIWDGSCPKPMDGPSDYPYMFYVPVALCSAATIASNVGGPTLVFLRPR